MIRIKQRRYYDFFILTMFCFLFCTRPASAQVLKSDWPAVTNETKPWTRWWWHGNALTKEGITQEMEAYHKAGIGGLEITPIYGVYGHENEFVDYLSPKWMELLKHVLTEGTRLDMGIDMATGTGWPFGGPWVTNEDACKNLRYKVYQLEGGAILKDKIEYIQQPYLRLVGNQIYEVQENADKEGRTLMGTRKEPALVMNTKKVTITDIIDPVEKNTNLQALAIDQAQFEKPLKLTVLMAFGDAGQKLNLTANVTQNGKLNWKAPAGSWKLYAVFEGYHGKMVERAGPGGEGNVIDHFSGVALKNYLARFDNAFKGYDLKSLRAFFNDSYEVDDARGTADFTPLLFEEFTVRRGYDLREELPALLGKDDPEKNKRILCDYRETISELLLDNFTKQWKDWAEGKGALVRNQAHGSPSNILDLYAVVDIPEIEGTEPLRFKMASSSGNVSGKRLMSAEVATWLNEHFESNLYDVKEALDNFMLNGINHLVYHGTCYSPSSEPWPGRLFYAAVHLNPRNPLWKDFDALNGYVTRCQSFLQRTVPDNDILLYYPVYDRFSATGPEMIEHFDGIGKAFEGSGFALCAEKLLEKGYSFDYISDKQISETTFEKGRIKTSGKTLYKTLLIPSCQYMPVHTFSKIVSLAEAGANIVFIDNGPANVSGYKNLEKSLQDFSVLKRKISQMTAQNNSSATDAALNNEKLFKLLDSSGSGKEPMIDSGISCLRKRNLQGEPVYFIKNGGVKKFSGWLPLREGTDHAVMFDPMTGKSGKAKIKKSVNATDVYVILEPSESIIVEFQKEKVTRDDFQHAQFETSPVTLSGKWKVSFDNGGPLLPPSFESDSLHYWTDINIEAYANFSGTATYQLSFSRPSKESKRWLLKIDSVRESAEIFLNGQSIGTMIGPVFQLEFEESLLKDRNLLEIQVANLMANRIAFLDRNSIFWKKFYNVNFPARKRENIKDNLFNAAHWKTSPSGISGKVRLFPFEN